ncbi:TlpA family protein disulfide reductase [Calidifontibacter terrae]
MTSRPSRRLAGAAALLAIAGLTGCSSDPNSIAAQAKDGDSKGYVAGDGTVQQLAVSQRGKPVTVSGTTLDGKAWSTKDAADKVVVLNVWGEWCPPCQKEIPQLQEVWTGWQKSGAPVQLMGLDQRDSVARATAILRTKKATYPSLRDDGGRSLLALQGKAQYTPTTLVLDKQHRIAARVSGPVDASTLRGLVQDVLAGK